MLCLKNSELRLTTLGPLAPTGAMACSIANGKIRIDEQSHVRYAVLYSRQTVLLALSHSSSIICNLYKHDKAHIQPPSTSNIQVTFINPDQKTLPSLPQIIAMSVRSDFQPCQPCQPPSPTLYSMVKDFQNQHQSRQLDSPFFLSSLFSLSVLLFPICSLLSSLRLPTSVFLCLNV